MRYRLMVLLFAAFFCLPASALPKYFGYFANNDYQHENQDHTNITMVWTGDDTYASAWDAMILSELAQAKSYGNKAIVIVSSHLFDTSDPAHYRSDPFAVPQFAALVDKMVAAGYLVPGNPEASTVVAFYPVDEPELYGLSDVSGGAHPALMTAINVIRSNNATWNFPVAVMSSHEYAQVLQGLRQFDWAGIFHYTTDILAYYSEFQEFTSRLRPEQRTIFMPQVAIGGDLDGSAHNGPLAVAYGYASRNIMFMPFLWARSAPGAGLRDMPELRALYATAGKFIKYGLESTSVGSYVPNPMVAGQYYNASVTFRNASQWTWRAGTMINLGSESPLDNMTWGLRRVALPHDVGPSQNVTFNFTIRAPTSPGTYGFQWKMVADGVAWFGEASPNTTAYVIAPPSGSISANPNPCVIPYGGSVCTTRLTWNSNRADAEVWVSATDGSGAQLFGRAQSHSQYATWITTGTSRFTLWSGGVPITHVDVYGVQSTEPPPVDPPPCPTQQCMEP